MICPGKSIDFVKQLQEDAGLTEAQFNTILIAVFNRDQDHANEVAGLKSDINQLRARIPND